MTPIPSNSEPLRTENESRLDGRERATKLFAQLPGETNQRIDWHAHGLCRRVPSATADEDDHKQDLSLDLLLKLPAFDERRAGLRTFASQIVDSSSKNLLRHYNAEKRGGVTLSIESIADRSNPKESHQSTDDLVGRDRRRSWPMRDDLTRQNLEADCQECFTQLTPVQRELCRYLGRRTEREIAELIGTSRHVVRAHIQEIRETFIRNEMSAYL